MIEIVNELLLGLNIYPEFDFGINNAVWTMDDGESYLPDKKMISMWFNYEWSIDYPLSSRYEDVFSSKAPSLNLMSTVVNALYTLFIESYKRNRYF